MIDAANSEMGLNRNRALAVARDIVEEQGVWIDVETEVCVYLPRASA